MAHLRSLFCELTPQLLSFCWKDIKYSYKLTCKFSLRPFHSFYIPFRWFVKVSYLLKQGKLKYSKYVSKQYSVNKDLFIVNNAVNNFKHLVLQKALINGRLSWH